MTLDGKNGAVQTKPVVVPRELRGDVDTRNASPVECHPQPPLSISIHIIDPVVGKPGSLSEDLDQPSLVIDNEHPPPSVASA